MAWRGPTTKPTVNRPPNKVNDGPEMSDMKKEVSSISGPPVFGPEANRNRAYNVRRDNDDRKDFSVKLIDIDATILNHMDTVISPVVVDSGRQVKVPINYASPERWKAIRKDGALRDKNGKVQTPAIAFRRSTVQRNDSLITLNRYLNYPVMKKFSEKNKYDKFSVMNGFAPRKEIYSVAMPDHIVVNYEFIIWTELIEQCNSIIEAINFATEDYWGDKNRYKFRTSISDYNFETTVDAGQDRIVKATFSLMCNAYLLPEKFENYKATTQKAFSQRKVVFGIDSAVVDGTKISPNESSNSTADIYSSKLNSFGFESLRPTSQVNGISQNANYAINAGGANLANYATTASYVDTLDIEGSFKTVNVIGGGTTGSFVTNTVSGINSDSGSVYIDNIQTGDGNAAKWLVSINDGNLNYKNVEVVASWNNYSVQFNSTDVNQIGSVPVHLSVSNSVSGSINLVATPLSGIWAVKLIRMVI